MTVDVVMEDSGACLGQDAVLFIVLKNRSSSARTVDLQSRVEAVDYTEHHKAFLRKDQTRAQLKPHEIQSLEWILQYEEYKEELEGQTSLLLSLSGRITETKQTLVKHFTFRLRTPDLVLTPVGDAVVGQELKVKLKFQNPLVSVLRNVIFRMEGLGLQHVKTIHYGDITGGATVRLTEIFVPKRSGPQKLLATLDCPQLTQVHGVANILVKHR